MKNTLLHIIYSSKKQFKLVLFVFVLVLTNPLFSQNKKQLEAKRKKLQTEIKKINHLLSKTKKSEKNVLSQLDDINKKIEVHQNIISTIQKENKVYTTEIKKNKQEIDSIEKRLTILKKEYAKTVIESYKSKNKNSRLLFILSSKDFLQAYKRLQYMNQFADFRMKQANDIAIKKELLLKLNDSILTKKKIKDSLITIQLNEQKVVNIEKDKKQKLLDKVKKKERKYLAKIRKKQKQERAYEKQLEDMIAKVIKKSYKRSGKKSSSAKKFYLTKEAKKLASNFAKNKGKLPAPVVKGYISRYFGQRKHEVMKKIDVKSSGWYYTTAKKAKARAIFKGTVQAIMVDRKTKIKTVIIKHGNYMTVYGNLENLLVKEGDKVTTKQYLGTIHTDTTTDKTILKFQLWKDAKAQNPSAWMFK